MSAGSAYKLRKHPAAAGFRAAWDAAVTTVMGLRSPNLLERALAGVSGPARFDGLEYTRNRPISTKPMIRLLDGAEARVAKLQKRAKA